MAKNQTNPDKAFVMAMVGASYQGLKARRAELLGEAQIQIEVELEAARQEFANLVQKARTDDGVSISQLMEAMGTSDRKTVYGYLNRGNK